MAVFQTQNQEALTATTTTSKIHQNNKPKDITREITGNIRVLEGEGNERRFLLSFSSEEPYTRWFGNEILDHSNGACDVSRLNDIGCVLFNHNRDRVIGKVCRAWIENGRGEAEIEFDKDEFSETIFQKVKNQTLKGVSIGYVVNNWEEVVPGKKSADGRFTGPCSIARSWCPYEISIVSVPADSTVGVGRAQSNQNDLALFEAQLQININS